MYGILRAPRAAGTEALVLSVPFRPPGSDYEKTAAGMALILGVAKGFRSIEFEKFEIYSAYRYIIINIIIYKYYII